jgi:Spy/CpxP family protein refolding chaperone
MMITRCLTLVAVTLSLVSPAAAADREPFFPLSHEELSRALGDLMGQIQGMGTRWREHLLPPEGAEPPLISIALSHRAELALTPQQVDALERLRTSFQREAIKRDADLRVAEMDLAALRRVEPVDLGQVEAKVREIERLKADLRVARIRTIEQGRAQLTPEQREKLRALVGGGEPPARSRAATPPPRERL